MMMHLFLCADHLCKFIIMCMEGNLGIPRPSPHLRWSEHERNDCQRTPALICPRNSLIASFWPRLLAVVKGLKKNSTHCGGQRSNDQRPREV